MMLRRFFLLLLLAFPLCAEEITVDFTNPYFKEGTFSTAEGGILEGEGIRIQARFITYTKEEEKITLVAKGDLMVEYGCDLLTGDSFEYDFTSKTGALYEGRIETGPWYIGAKKIFIFPGGCYTAKEAFLTTCEGKKGAEWGLYAKRIRIRKNGEISAVNVQGRLGNIPFLWLPSFEANIHSFEDSPLSYKAEADGLLGGRIGIRYHFFTYRDLRAFLRCEYIFGRGPAAGVETEWCPPNRKGQGYTQSYVARDRSINDPKTRTRYRFAGAYEECYSKGYWGRVFYDVLSDREMPSDYRLADFNLHTARTTQADFGRTTPYWVARFRARPRVNSFQTISQEFPNVEWAAHPYPLPYGIIGMTRASAGYWDTQFAQETLRNPTPGLTAHSFHSSRFALQQTLSRPFCSRILNFLPEATLLGIHYSEGSNTLGTDPNPEPLGPKWLGWVRGDLQVNTRLTRKGSCFKHTLEPYLHAAAAIQPTSRNDTHPLFTSKDAYTNLQWLRFGLLQELYYKERNGCLYHPLSFDLFTYAFLDTPTIIGQIPRIYGKVTYCPTRSLEAILAAAWNASHNQIDHFNAHIEWTLSEKVAFNVELRYRSKYTWRKADSLNFTLDTFTPEGALLSTPLSDQRYTVLIHAFFRLHPTVGVELETRHGFQVRLANQAPPKKAYNEGKISLHLLLPCRFQATCFFEHLEADNRGGIRLTLGNARRPPTLGRRSGVW